MTAQRLRVPPGREVCRQLSSAILRSVTGCLLSNAARPCCGLIWKGQWFSDIWHLVSHHWRTDTHWWRALSQKNAQQWSPVLSIHARTSSSSAPVHNTWQRTFSAAANPKYKFNYFHHWRCAETKHPSCTFFILYTNWTICPIPSLHPSSLGKNPSASGHISINTIP